MFRTVPLSIIRSFFFSVNTAVVYVIQLAVLILLASCMTYTIAVCTEKNTPDDG